jgi:pheromone shutdown protein TraB
VIILIGVGHVFKIRDRLQEEIRRARPGVVCLELDRTRMSALLEQRRREAEGLPGERRFDWRTIGRGGLIFAFLVLMQARLAKSYGSRAGDEMLAAFEVAREVGARTELIDMDSNLFFARWMRSLSFKERMRLLLSVFGGVFASRKRVEKELGDFYNDEDAFVRQLGEQFPGTKKALIDDRNVYMANGIRAARASFPVVVAVIGEGHLSGIRDELLKAGEPADGIRTISLRELQEPPHADGPAARMGASNAEVSISYPAPSPQATGHDPP